MVSFVGIDSARDQREFFAQYARGRHEFGTNINQFAKRSATPGSLYSYVTRGFGVNVGFLAGWCLILAYLFAGMALLSGAVNYAGLLLDMLHLHSSPVALYAVGSFGAWLIAYKDIKLSTRVMLVLEVVSHSTLRAAKRSDQRGIFHLDRCRDQFVCPQRHAP
jgi:hypothetical protein